MKWKHVVWLGAVFGSTGATACGSADHWDDELAPDSDDWLGISQSPLQFSQGPRFTSTSPQVSLSGNFGSDVTLSRSGK